MGAVLVPRPGRRLVAGVALLAVAGLLVGCGDDDPDDAAPPSTSAPASTDAGEPPDLGDADLASVTGRRLCRLLTPGEASAALGTEVVSATPSDESTPQCTYSYGGDSSTLSSFTLASQRPEDVGGRGLQEAFDHILEINRGLAVGTATDESDIAAGDRAVSLAGEALTLTVIAVDDHLLTLLTTPDVDAAAVEALAEVVVDEVS